METTIHNIPKTFISEDNDITLNTGRPFSPSSLFVLRKPQPTTNILKLIKSDKYI